MWDIEFFENDNGRCPSKEYILSLNPVNDQPFIDNAFDRLRKLGNELTRPQSGFLKDGLYELIIDTRTGHFRFIYFFDGRKIIVVTHGFLKKSRKIPQGEIEKANNYRAIYFSRK